MDIILQTTINNKLSNMNMPTQIKNQVLELNKPIQIFQGPKPPSICDLTKSLTPREKLIKKENDKFLLDKINEIHKELGLEPYKSLKELDQKPKVITESELENMCNKILKKTVNLYQLKKEDVVPFYETITKLEKILRIDNINEAEISRTRSGNIKISYFKLGKYPVEALFNDEAEPIWLKFENGYDDEPKEIFLFDKNGNIKSRISFTDICDDRWNEKLKDFEEIKIGVDKQRIDYPKPLTPDIIAVEYKKKTF